MSTFCITSRLFRRRSTTSLNLVDQLIRNKIKSLLTLTIQQQQQSKGFVTQIPNVYHRKCLYSSITSTNISKYYHLNKFLIPANNYNFVLLKTSSAAAAAVLDNCTRSYRINNNNNNHILTQQQSLKLNYVNSLLIGGGSTRTLITSSQQNSSLCATTIMELNSIKRSYSKKQSKINDKNDSKDATKTGNADDHQHDDDHEPTEQKKLGIVGRFKQMYKQYWYVLLPVHLATSAGWLVGFYYLSKGGVDIPSLLQALSISDSIIDKLKDSTMGHLAISYMCYKIITPVRYMVTVGGTTLSINYLSKMGYIRPMPSKAQFKKMYDDRKTKMKNDFENKIESSKFWKQTDETGDNEKRK